MILVLFYLNSFVMASLALILTFVLMKLQNKTTAPPNWITSSTIFILRSKVGQILLLSVLDPKASAGLECDADDNSGLVREDSKTQPWTHVTVLLSSLSFGIFFFTYLIMYAILIPGGSMPPVESLIFHPYST